MGLLVRTTSEWLAMASGRTVIGIEGEMGPDSRVMGIKSQWIIISSEKIYFLICSVRFFFNSVYLLLVIFCLVSKLLIYSVHVLINLFYIMKRLWDSSCFFIFFFLEEGCAVFYILCSLFFFKNILFL